MKLLLFYLADDGRHFTFAPFVNLINESKHKVDWKIIVLTHGETGEFYHQILSTTNIQHDIFSVPHHNNYLVKVNFAIKYAKDHQIPYMMKCDNDIFFRGRTLDYMIDNLHLLNDTNNLTIGPVLSSGIPTVEYFVEEYLTQHETDTLKALYLKTQFTDIWGAKYSHHNKYTLEASKWDGRSFLNDVKQNTHHYKGIHPIRINFEAIKYLNSCIIGNKRKFYDNLQLSVFADKISPYLCNSVFCIRTDIYDTIVQDGTLYVDSFDEVPLNKYAWKNSTAHLFVENGFAIHMYYNTFPNNRVYEAEFCKKFFNIV